MKRVCRGIVFPFLWSLLALSVSPVLAGENSSEEKSPQEKSAAAAVEPFWFELSPGDYLGLADEIGLSDEQRKHLKELFWKVRDQDASLRIKLHANRKEIETLSKQWAASGRQDQEILGRLEARESEARDLEKAANALQRQAARDAQALLPPEKLASEPAAARLRSHKSGRARQGMAEVAQALEGYRLENGAYPASVPGDSEESVAKNKRRFADVSTFSSSQQGLMAPIPFFAEGYPADPFASTSETSETFAYHRIAPDLYLLTSPGPDGDYDIKPAELFANWSPANAAGIAKKINALAYQSKKGEILDGDLVLLPVQWQLLAGKR